MGTSFSHDHYLRLIGYGSYHKATANIINASGSRFHAKIEEYESDHCVLWPPVESLAANNNQPRELCFSTANAFTPTEISVRLWSGTASLSANGGTTHNIESSWDTVDAHRSTEN